MELDIRGAQKEDNQIKDIQVPPEIKIEGKVQNIQDKPTGEPDVNETRRLRQYLKLYFYSAIKWKRNALSIHLIYCLVFGLQIIKVALVTTQMFKCGNDRADFSLIVNRGHRTLRHMLLETWDASWETLPYPPAHGEFAVYDITSLASRINYAVEKYYNAEKEAIGFYQKRKNDKMAVKLKYFDFTGFMDSQSLESRLDINDVEFAVDKGITKHIDTITNETNYKYSIAEEFAYQNLSQPFKRLLSITLDFTLHSVRVVESLRQVRCLTVHGWISFDDLDNNGQVIEDLETITKSIKCTDVDLKVPDWTVEEEKSEYIGAAVIVFCVMSVLFTTSSITFAMFLVCKTKSYMRRYYRQYYKPLDEDEHDLPTSQYIRFFNFWDVTVVLSDILTLIGTVVFETKKYNWALTTLDSQTVWLGVGWLLAWLSLLRFFKFHNKFHLLFSTIYRAFLDVLAYLVCVSVLFIGFWACGYVVMGPFHVKFRTPASAAETLLSVVTGDEIYTTLNILEVYKSGGNWVWWFSRCYITAYVAIFTVAVINILIAIFMSAYESIKEYYEEETEDRDLGPVEKALKRVLEKSKQDDCLRSSIYNLMSNNERQLSAEEKSLQTALNKLIRMSSSRKDVALYKPKTLKEFYEGSVDANSALTCGCLKLSFALFSGKQSE